MDWTREQRRILRGNGIKNTYILWSRKRQLKCLARIIRKAGWEKMTLKGHIEGKQRINHLTLLYKWLCIFRPPAWKLEKIYILGCVSYLRTCEFCPCSYVIINECDFYLFRATMANNQLTYEMKWIHLLLIILVIIVIQKAHQRWIARSFVHEVLKKLEASTGHVSPVT